MTELTDLSETDADNTPISGTNIAEGCAPSGINNAIRSTLGLVRRAFKTSIFRIRDATDQTKLLAFDLLALTTATTRTLAIPDKSGTIALTSDIPAVIKGHIFGLGLSNNSGDAANDIDLAVGEASSDDTTPVLIALAAALTKRLDASWAVGTGNGGLDTGAIANATYHLFLIRRPDTGVVDALFSTSATAPTMPTNYTQKRRIGSILREGGSIVAFVQRDDEFQISAPTLDVDVNNPGGSAVTRSLRVPAGIQVTSRAIYSVSNAGTGVNALFLATSLDATDVAPSSTTAPLAHLMNVTNGPGGVSSASAQIDVKTDSSRQVRTRLSASDANVGLRISTRGWIDSRGR